MATKRSAMQSSAMGATVTPQQGIALVMKLIDRAKYFLTERAPESADEQTFCNLARDYLTRTFGARSANVGSVVHAGAGALHVGMSRQELVEYYRATFARRITILAGCIEQLETEIELQGTKPAHEAATFDELPPHRKRVFVVHGHNRGIKETVARLLEKLGLQTVILHEQPNQGQTVIEKFSSYSDVHFAVVLLTADDEGRARGQQELRLRARQNVIFELGYFIAKLGRHKVCALYEPGVEIPSDYQGVLFVKYEGNEWRSELFQELLAAGLEMDANKLFERD